MEYVPPESLINGTEIGGHAPNTPRMIGWDQQRLLRRSLALRRCHAIVITGATLRRRYACRRCTGNGGFFEAGGLISYRRSTRINIHSLS